MRYTLTLSSGDGSQMVRVYNDLFFTNNELEYVGRNIVDMYDTLTLSDDLSKVLGE